MKTFEEIYEEIQKDNNNELNNAWNEAKKEKVKSKKIALIVCLIIDLLIIIFAEKNISVINGHFVFLPMIFICLILDIIIYGVMTTTIFSKEYTKYNKVYKETLIKKIMNNFFENLEYFPKKEMPEYIYENVNYNEHYDIYESEDYFEAYIKEKYSIQMAEILTQKEEEYTDSDGEEHTRTITVFNGLFAKVLMHKSIMGQLKIMQNRTIFSKNKLEMDSSEFEKYFDVEASNKIVGMQLLTADVMEELIAFQNNTNIKYDIFIKDNELYLRFHCGEMFEPGKLKNGPIDKDLLRKYFYMLNFTYNLSNKLIKVINETII